MVEQFCRRLDSFKSDLRRKEKKTINGTLVSNGGPKKKEEEEEGVKRTEEGVKRTEEGVKKTEDGVKKTEEGVKGKTGVREVKGNNHKNGEVVRKGVGGRTEERGAKGKAGQKRKVEEGATKNERKVSRPPSACRGPGCKVLVSTNQSVYCSSSCLEAHVQQSLQLLSTAQVTTDSL